MTDVAALARQGARAASARALAVAAMQRELEAIAAGLHAGWRRCAAMRDASYETAPIDLLQLRLRNVPSTPPRRARRDTRATTVLVAFDAGARTERPEENGMAHFLEHLVFKGGEKYDDYRKVNETAERMGGVAQRLHVATTSSRSTSPSAPRRRWRRIDLLTDFVGRPKHRRRTSSTASAASSSRRSTRYKDQPSAVAEHLIDRARVRRPPARAHRARPRGAPAHVHARRDRRLPRAPLGRRARRRVRRRQRRARARQRRRGRAASARFPALPAPEPFEPAPALQTERAASSSATPTSRTCG